MFGICPLYQPGANVPHVYVSGGEVGIVIPPGPTNRTHVPEPKRAPSQVAVPLKVVLRVVSFIVVYDEQAGGKVVTKYGIR